ncbi:MAG TPA: CPBP family intramembrane metalloprotease [Firmicutes bacterium]|jgi:membrane protease YdiL (CAAX protease family)|nr:CPBP family intramembrane metalloprotease [Bacillota bacterium]
MRDVLKSSIIQVSFVLILALLSYLLFCKKKNGFFNWIGLYLPKNREWIISSIVLLAASFLVMVGPLILLQYFGEITADIFYDKTISGQGLSINIIVIILLKAVIQTSLSEELFFRGLIGKRIANKFGYLAGNITQAIIFGLPHGLPFMIIYQKYLFGITFFITTGLAGYLQFWLNEKKANGSLIPSILMHSIANITSFISQALS